MSKRVVILGAGISGLSCAWFLKKRFGSSLAVTILEKSSRLGGWIDTEETEGFLFEKGPRSCRTQGAGLKTLELIEELQLQDQVIVADSQAHIRYLYTGGTLEKLPSTPLSLFRSPLMKGGFSALVRDLIAPTGQEQDESIEDFMSRRFNLALAHQFMDPLVSGIYAGDIKKLSLKSCFPLLHQLEQQHRSVLWGVCRSQWTKACRKAWGKAWKTASSFSVSPFVQRLKQEPLISFKQGMSTLIQALANQWGGEIRFNCSPKALTFHPEGVSLALPHQQTLEADHLILAIPAPAIADLLAPHHPPLQRLLSQLPYATVAVVNLGYRANVLKQKGFGYLVPSSEKESILGCVWDSSIFPQQNRHPNETRLTLMMGGTLHPFIEESSESHCLDLALEALARHLNIQEVPDFAQVKIAKQAIIQYEVGYSSLKETLHSILLNSFPHLTLIGPINGGVSVNECIAQAEHQVIHHFSSY